MAEPEAPKGSGNPVKDFFDRLWHDAQSSVSKAPRPFKPAFTDPEVQVLAEIVHHQMIGNLYTDEEWTKYPKEWTKHFGPPVKGVRGPFTGKS
jgi:hypothetical protein